VTILGLGFMLAEGLTLAGAMRLAESAAPDDNSGEQRGDPGTISPGRIEVDRQRRAAPEPARRGTR